MNWPSLVNFTMRAEPNLLGLWPSDTKMSPLGAIATPVGRSNVSGPLPATPSLPSTIKTLLPGHTTARRRCGVIGWRPLHLSADEVGQSRCFAAIRHEGGLNARHHAQQSPGHMTG